MSSQCSIEQLIAGSYIKYNRLGELISMSYSGSDCEEINLFIDLNSILKQLFTGNEWSYKFESKFDIVSALVNMCGHYREFFRGLGVYTNIFLIYGLNCPQANNVFVANYNYKLVKQYQIKGSMFQTVEENLGVLKLMCSYLPNVYFFHIGNCEVHSMIDKIIWTVQNPRVENIIISKDPLVLQLIPLHNARVLRPFKNQNGDESFIVDNGNLWKMFATMYRRCKISSASINPSFFPNVLCMISVLERNMFSVFNFTKCMSLIDTAIKNNLLDNSSVYTQEGINTALSTMGVHLNAPELEMRYKAISSRYQSTCVLPIERPDLNELHFNNFEDRNGLQEIISKYFEKNPIDLNRL